MLAFLYLLFFSKIINKKIINEKLKLIVLCEGLSSVTINAIL